RASSPIRPAVNPEPAACETARGWQLRRTSPPCRECLAAPEPSLVRPAAIRPRGPGPAAAGSSSLGLIRNSGELTLFPSTRYPRLFEQGLSSVRRGWFNSSLLHDAFSSVT